MKNKLETLRLEQKKNLVFGIPLRDVIANSKAPGPHEIPLLVRRCVDYVEQIGLQEEGIYRISGNQTDQKELRERFDAGIGYPLHFYLGFLEPQYRVNTSQAMTWTSQT